MLIGRLSADEHPGRVLDAVFDPQEEGDGFFAIHDAMIVAEGQIHHGADDDLSINGHGALLDAVHAEDRALRRVEDGRAQERAVDAAVGDGEDAAGEVADLEFAVFGFFRVGEDVEFEVGEGFFVAVVEDGNNEAAFGADGDADVVVVLVDDFVALDADVDAWDGFESFDDGFDEKGHEAEFDAIFGEETVLKFFAHVHDSSHVTLVESGEDGGGLLGADELVSDFAAQGCHFFPGDTA